MKNITVVAETLVKNGFNILRKCQTKNPKVVSFIVEFEGWEMFSKMFSWQREASAQLKCLVDSSTCWYEKREMQLNVFTEMHPNIVEVIRNKINGYLLSGINEIREDSVEYGISYFDEPWEFMERMNIEVIQETGHDCIWDGEHTITISTSPLSAEAKAEAITREEKKLKQKEEKEAKKAIAHTGAKEKTAYAQECGRLARKYRIVFVNVLRIGHNEEELKRHKASMKQAMKKAKMLSSTEKRSLSHEIFCCGRARKKAALSSLGIYWGCADVNRMDFSQLEKVLG